MTKITANDAIGKLKSTESVENLPLGVLYSLSTLVQQHLESIISSKDDTLVSKAMFICQLCDRMVESQGIFSSNEEQDDVSTSDLKFFLASWHAAEVLASAPSTSTSLRSEQAQAAERCYSRFLQRCSQYKLLGDLGARIYKQEEEIGPLDASTKRLVKIEKFKQDKAINNMLQHLLQQRSAAASKEQDATEEGPLGGANGWDEEDERKLWQLKIQSAALRALDQRAMIRQEVEMLKQIPSDLQGRATDGRMAQSSARAEMEAEQKQQMMEQLRKIAGELDLGGNKREQLLQQVFQPGHLLPTMSLEQLARIEMEEAQQREEVQRKSEAKERARKEAAGSDDEEDVMRQRAHDDWKDSNPRGWGNSKLRPCG